MKSIAVTTFFLTALAASSFGQGWEFGGTGGAGFLNNVNVSGAAGSATAGFQSGAAVGGFLGQNLYPHLSGEVRYAYLQNDLEIKSGGTKASFGGNAHTITYDLLLHTNKKESRVQLFIAAGGGLKIFRGTGQPQAYQPNYQFGYLTKAQELKPVGDVGAGIRFELHPHFYLRTEFRDFITTFPKDIITPAPGTKYGSILHDIVPMVSLSYER